MKIIEKIHFTVNTKPFFNFMNASNAPIILPLVQAHSITGMFEADAYLAPTNKDDDDFEDFWHTRILYNPYYSKGINGTLYREPDETDPEHNFRSLPPDKQENPSQEDIDYLSSPITIPPDVQELSVIINKGDIVTISADVTRTHAIIDDNGNEIPLETLLDERDAKIEKRLTEKMLEIVK